MHSQPLFRRDPLLPPPKRIRQVQRQMGSHMNVAVIRDAAHAINFSHPVELSELIRAFTHGQPHTSSLESHPGAHGHESDLSPIAVMV
jgi:hypothetical protein